MTFERALRDLVERYRDCGASEILHALGQVMNEVERKQEKEIVGEDLTAVGDEDN